MWADREWFNCETCAGDAEAKEQLGCEAPPKYSGTGTWKLPTGGAEVRVEVDRCPMALATWDILALFADGAATEWRATYAELDRMPLPYRQAMQLAAAEQALMRAEKAKVDSERRH